MIAWLIFPGAIFVILFLILGILIWKTSFRCTFWGIIACSFVPVLIFQFLINQLAEFGSYCAYKADDAFKELEKKP